MYYSQYGSQHVINANMQIVDWFIFFGFGLFGKESNFITSVLSLEIVILLLMQNGTLCLIKSIFAFQSTFCKLCLKQQLKEEFQFISGNNSLLSLVTAVFRKAVSFHRCTSTIEKQRVTILSRKQEQDSANTGSPLLTVSFRLKNLKPPLASSLLASRSTII